MCKESAVTPITAETVRTPFRLVRPSTLVLVAIVLLGAAIRIHFFIPDLVRSPDEQTFARQANVILAQGTAGPTALGKEFFQDPVAFSQSPSPARVGYLVLLAAFMRVIGDHSTLAGAQLSLLCSLAALSLVAFIAWRALSASVAIIATLLYTVFPFELTVSRRAWQESFIALVALVIVAVAVHVARTHSIRRTVGFISFFLLGVLSITTKENLAIHFMLCAAGLTLHFILKGQHRAAILAAACAAASGIVSVAILASVFGGFTNYVTLERDFIHYSFGPYEMQFNTGPAWMFPAAFFRSCPILAVAALAGFATTLYRFSRSGSFACADFAVGLVFLSFGTIAIQFATQRYNFRYTAPAFGPLCLLGGIGIEAVLQALGKLLAPLGRTVAWAILGFAISVAALRDFNHARDHFLLPRLQDLALRPISDVPPSPLPIENPR